MVKPKKPRRMTTTPIPSPEKEEEGAGEDLHVRDKDAPLHPLEGKKLGTGVDSMHSTYVI